MATELREIDPTELARNSAFAPQEATYTKLRDGSWGIRIHGTARTGDSVTVQKRDGATRVETVGKVLWSGDDLTICSIAASPRTSRPRSYGRRSGRYCCDECGEWVTRGDGSQCWETGCAH